MYNTSAYNRLLYNAVFGGSSEVISEDITEPIFLDKEANTVIYL